LAWLGSVLGAETGVTERERERERVAVLSGGELGQRKESCNVSVATVALLFHQFFK